MDKDNGNLYERNVLSVFDWRFTWAFSGSLKSKPKFEFDTKIGEILNSKFLVNYYIHNVGNKGRSGNIK